MTSPDRESLEREVALAEESVRQTRTANSQLAQRFREEPTEDLRELLKRAAESLAAARDRAERAAAVLALFERTGSLFGVVPRAGAVTGTIAVRLEPGISRAERTRRIDDALAEPLAQAAEELGATLAAAPERFARERPGRDAEGRTLLDVAGRVEGDLLVPAVSGPPRRA